MSADNSKAITEMIARLAELHAAGRIKSMTAIVVTTDGQIMQLFQPGGPLADAGGNLL